MASWCYQQHGEEERGLVLTAPLDGFGEPGDCRAVEDAQVEDGFQWIRRSREHDVMLATEAFGQQLTVFAVLQRNEDRAHGKEVILLRALVRATPESL